MPIYEYHCSTCGKEFEKLQSFEYRDLVYCPNCGRRPERQVSTFSFKFYNPFTKDGEGFTSTAYAPDEYKRRVASNAGKDDVYHKDFE